MLVRMSLFGAVIILVVTVIRVVAIHKLSKRLLVTFWEIALARLLLPVSFPPPRGPSVLTEQRPIVEKVEKCVVGLETDAARALGVHTPAISPLWLIWAAGALFCLGWFALRYLRCRREFMMSLPVRNDFVAKWLPKHPLRRTIEVRSLTGISTPLTYGLLHPVILMPNNTDWGNERQLRYVLYHEYVHVCRLDAIRKWAAVAAVCVHWFNPMVWMLYILFNRDIELACDECVLRRFGGEARASYARALIGMEETRHTVSPFSNCFAKNAIEERIESIMRYRKESVSALILALVLVTAVTGTAFAAAEAREITVPNLEGVDRVSDESSRPEQTARADDLFAAGQPSARPEVTGQPEAGVVKIGKPSERPENTVFDLEGTVTELADASSLSGEIAPHTGYTLKSLAIAAGQKLTVCIGNTGPEAKLKIGYVDAAGTVTYVTITGEGGSYSFTVRETGTYKLYIFNSSDYTLSGLDLSWNVTNS